MRGLFSSGTAGNRSLLASVTSSKSWDSVAVASSYGYEPFLYRNKGDALNSAAGTTLTAPATYGNNEYVLVWCTWGATTGTATITDGTNTYTQVGSNIVDATNTQTYALFYCENPVAGTYTLTYTPPGTQSWRAFGYARYSGLTGAPQTPVSNIQATPAQTADAVTSTAITPSVNIPAAVIGFCFGEGDFQTLSGGTGLISRGDFPNYNVQFLPDAMFEDKLVTDASALSATFTAANATRVLTLVTAIAEPASALSLAPSLFVNAATFFNSTVSSTYSLTPGLYTDADSYFTQTLSSSYSLIPALYTDADNFFAPNLLSTYILGANFYIDEETFYALTVVNHQTLTAGLFVDTDDFYSINIATSNSLIPNIYADDDTFYSPIVGNGASQQSLAPGLYDNVDTFFSPTLAWTYSLTSSLFTDSDDFYIHSVDFTGAGEIIVNWTQSLDPGVTGYYVYYDVISHSAGVYSDYAFYIDVPGRSSETLTISGITASTTYYVNISAHGAGGHDAFESELFGEISLTSHSVKSLAPSNLLTNDSLFFAPTVSLNVSGEILLSWTRSPDPSVTGYFVYYDVVSHSTGVYSDYSYSFDISGAETESFSITGLSPGLTYYVNISAHGAGGHDAFESELFGEISIVSSNLKKLFPEIYNAASYFYSPIVSYEEIILSPSLFINQSLVNNNHVIKGGEILLGFLAHLPTDPYLPLSDDVGQLKLKVYDLYRQIATHANKITDEINRINGL